MAAMMLTGALRKTPITRAQNRAVITGGCHARSEVRRCAGRLEEIRFDDYEVNVIRHREKPARLPGAGAAMRYQPGNFRTHAFGSSCVNDTPQP